jgi:hypothetical protein
VTRIPLADLFRQAVDVLEGQRIPYKLAAHRRKDLSHVEDILARQAGKLDLAYLREWARKIAEATGKFEIPATIEKMLAEQARGGAS